MSHTDAGGSGEKWSAGDLYEPYVGRWSRLVAARFVPWMGAGRGKRWLDVGCGTGALTRAIVDVADPASVRGIDPSAEFLAHARKLLRDRRVTFAEGTTESLAPAGETFDCVASGLALNFMPDPPRALRQMAGVTAPGGTIGIYLWDYAGKMELMRCFWDAAAALDPAARALDEGERFPLCNAEAMMELFGRAGLRDVEFRVIDVPTRFRGFDEYWSPFLGGQGPAPGYAASLGEMKRSELRERLRSFLPAAPDGSINLIARALAIKGATP